MMKPQDIEHWLTMKHKRSVISITMAAIVLVSLCAVCASTSVSAGNPIPANTSPSACIPRDNQYFYLFVQGYDGALWYNRQNMQNQGNGYWGWSGWTSLGGQMTSSPCAVARSSNTVDVFVRGTNGALYEKTTTNSGTSWSGWMSLGGQLASGTGPGACSNASREDVFVEGTNGALYQKTWTAASGWSSGWASLGGKLTSSPAAASRGTGLIDVHVRGTNGADWYVQYYNRAWHNWATIGGAIASGTGLGVSVWHQHVGPSQAADREDVFLEGTNGALYQKTWTASNGWTTSWANLGGKLTSSPTAAMEGYAIEVYARFTDGYLYLKEYYNGAWTAWMGGSMRGPPGTL